MFPVTFDVILGAMLSRSDPGNNDRDLKMETLTLGRPMNSWRIAPEGLTQDRVNAHWHKHHKWCRQYGWTGWKQKQERLSDDGFVDQVACNGRIIDVFGEYSY